MLAIALLDDYARLAMESADWSALSGNAEIAGFDVYLSEEEAAEALAPFDVLCTIRERMAFPASLLNRLPKLKLITTIGPPGANVDVAAATANGVLICQTNMVNPARRLLANATPELAWGLMIASVRHLESEARRVREGLWSNSAGAVLAGRTLGLLGLGNIGRRMARYAKAFDMDVIAWSQNLTPDKAVDHGARYVSKDELFQQADILSIHLKLSERTRGLVTARELALMKPHARLVNTSRGPIVVEADLIAALRARRIAGAALDVFDQEPLPADHAFRTMDNVIATPHLGYVTRETMAGFYSDTVALLAAYAEGAPQGVVNPEVLQNAKQRRP